MEPASQPGAEAPRPIIFRALDGLTGAIAVLGGVLMLAAATLVVVSVLGRWLLSSPVDGDFEFVKMGTAIAIFAYLPFTQARRGNIIVDTFTTRLPLRVQSGLDALWTALYALVAGAIAYALTHGVREAFESGETTMQRQIVLWPSIAICTVLAGLLAVTAAVSAIAILTRGGRRGAP